MGRIRFTPNPAAAANGIKFPSGGNVSAAFQFLQDPGGNSLPIAVATNGVNFGTGAITNNGAVTVKSTGGNIISFRNNADAQVGYIENGGLAVFASIVSQSGLGLGNGVNNVFSVGDGIVRFTNTATTNFTRIIFGSNDVNGVSFVKNATTIRCMLGNASALTPFEASQFTSDNLSAGTLATARPFKVGDRGSVTEAGLTALGLDRQIAIEHNGVLYYIPVSQTIIP